MALKMSRHTPGIGGAGGIGGLGSGSSGAGSGCGCGIGSGIGVGGSGIVGLIVLPSAPPESHFPQEHPMRHKPTYIASRNCGPRHIRRSRKVWQTIQ